MKKLQLLRTRNSFWLRVNTKLGSVIVQMSPDKTYGKRTFDKLMAASTFDNNLGAHVMMGLGRKVR